MKKLMITLRVTAKRDYQIDGTFIGKISYVDGKHIRTFSYVSGDPRNKMIDISYVDTKTSKSFKVEILPMRELMSSFPEYQRLIIVSSLQCIYVTIKNARGLSFAKTKLMREFGFGRESEEEWPLELSEDSYNLIFK